MAYTSFLCKTAECKSSTACCLTRVNHKKGVEAEKTISDKAKMTTEQLTCVDAKHTAKQKCTNIVLFNNMTYLILLYYLFITVYEVYLLE